MLEGKELHDKFLKILWDNPSRIIGIDWKETTAEMSDEEFKADLTTFGYVEQKKADGIFPRGQQQVTIFDSRRGAYEEGVSRSVICILGMGRATDCCR